MPRIYNFGCRKIRNLSHRLAPAFLEDTNLEEALFELLESVNVENRYKVSLQMDKSIDNYMVSYELQLNLYRILQEQLRNIVKYSQAALVTVQIQLLNNRLYVIVTDKGIGFDFASQKKGIGFLT